MLSRLEKDQGFSLGGLDPIQHLSPFLDQGLSPLPAKVRPRKFEKFKYILCHICTFKLKSILKSCISCLE